MFWIDNNPRVAEDFGNASAIGAYDWGGAGHGFGIDEAEGFLEQGWAGEDGGFLEVAGEFVVVVNVAGERDVCVPGLLEGLREFADLAHIGSFLVNAKSSGASDDEFGAGVTGK